MVAPQSSGLGLSVAEITNNRHPCLALIYPGHRNGDPEILVWLGVPFIGGDPVLWLRLSPHSVHVSSLPTWMLVLWAPASAGLRLGMCGLRNRAAAASVEESTYTGYHTRAHDKVRGADLLEGTNEVCHCSPATASSPSF